MKIIQQTVNNECGVCVVNMMANHLFKKEIDKNVILAKANLTPQGINLLDLEILASHFNLEAESYEATVDEIIEQKIQDYFVAIIVENGMQHFVVVKLVDRNIFKIYNPNGKITIMNLDEFRSIFTNIIVKFKKINKFLNYQVFDKKYLNCIRFSTIAIIILFELITIPLGIVISKLTNYIFDLVIEKNHIINLLNLGLIYFFIFLTNNFKNFFQNIFIHKKVNQIELNIQHTIIQKIIKKDCFFIQKTSIAEMNSLTNIIDNIVGFLVVTKPKIYVSFLYASVIILILAINSWILLLVSFTFVLITLIISLISFTYNKKNTPTIINLQNNLFHSFQNFIKVVFREHNSIKLNFYINHYKDETMKLINHEKKVNIVNNKIDFWSNLINQISLFSVVAVYIFYNFQKKLDINYGSLIFVIFLHSNLNEISTNVIGFIMNGVNLKHNISIIDKFYSINNIEDRAGFKIDKITSLEINYKQKLFQLNDNTLIIGRSGIGKTTFLKQFLNFNNFQNLIKINNLDADAYQTSSLKNKIIYQNSESAISNFDLEKFLSLESNVNILQKINSEINVNWSFLSNNNDSLISSGQRQLIAFIDLLSIKNSLILLDEPLSHLDPKLKKVVINNVLSEIQKNNLVLYVSHDLNLKNFFQKVVDFDEEFLN